MNSFAEHPPHTLLIMFILLIVMLFVSNHQLKRMNAVECMLMVVCCTHLYCIWNTLIRSAFIHQLQFIRSIDVHHAFIQWNSFSGLWCSVVGGGVVNDVGVQDAMEPNEVVWGVVVSVVLHQMHSG